MIFLAFRLGIYLTPDAGKMAAQNRALREKL
jgi:hypothetical protein